MLRLREFIEAASIEDKRNGALCRQAEREETDLETGPSADLNMFRGSTRHGLAIWGGYQIPVLVYLIPVPLLSSPMRIAMHRMTELAGPDIYHSTNDSKATAPL